jgi:hypothetical protein
MWCGPRGVHHVPHEPKRRIENRHAELTNIEQHHLAIRKLTQLVDVSE